MTTITGAINTNATVEQLDNFIYCGGLHRKFDLGGGGFRTTMIGKVKGSVSWGLMLFDEVRDSVRRTACSVITAVLTLFSFYYEMVFGNETTRLRSLHEKTIVRLSKMDKSEGIFRTVFEDHEERLKVRSTKLELLIECQNRRRNSLGWFNKMGDPLIRSRGREVSGAFEAEIEKNTAQLESVNKMKEELNDLAPKSISNLWRLFG